VLTLGYLLLLVLIPPAYEVPQNDDWAYFLTIQQWFETGRLQHLGWNDPTLLSQVLWGALFAKLFGLSYTSLRLSTLVLSWLGVLALYGILRRAGTSRVGALLGAGVLLFNPIGCGTKNGDGRAVTAVPLSCSREHAGVSPAPAMP